MMFLALDSATSACLATVWLAEVDFHPMDRLAELKPLYLRAADASLPKGYRG